jgi:hypothetical protein
MTRGRRDERDTGISTQCTLRAAAPREHERVVRRPRRLSAKAQSDPQLVCVTGRCLSSADGRTRSRRRHTCNNKDSCGRDQDRGCNENSDLHDVLQWKYDFWPMSHQIPWTYTPQPRETRDAHLREI